MALNKILHFGVHGSDNGSPIAMNANAGDTLLFQATRDLFAHFFGPLDFHLKSLWENLNAEGVEVINGTHDLVLIGGGGLFLRDQSGATTSRSGWQWNCDIETLQSIKSPLVVFGVGYNRFRNQPDFEPPFADHLRALVEKSTFFGLRNHGSIYAVRRYVPTELQDRIEYQPCPTTVLHHIYPQARGEQMTKGAPVVAVNAAFDRSHLRMGEREADILSAIARSARALYTQGWKVVLVNHKPQDAGLEIYLQKEHIEYTTANLFDSLPDDIIKFYLGTDMVVGMRGHAQMIPFGLKKKIVSIISHDKMGWFLDDIRHPEWGVDVERADFSEALEQTVRHVAESNDIDSMITDAQEFLWNRTMSNMEKIRNKLS